MSEHRKLKGRCLLAFDADNIKEYVFGTGRLREIRGASDIVRSATSRSEITRVTGLPEYDPGSDAEGVVFAAGGSGLLLLDDPRRAPTMCAEIEAHYARQTVSATLSATALECDSDDFQGAMAQLSGLLRRRKASHMAGPDGPNGGSIAYCGACRRYPVQGRDSHDDPDDPSNGALLCESCLKKRSRSRQVRRGRSILGQPYWQEFVKPMTAEERAMWEDPGVLANGVRDFQSIGSRGQPRGYLGFVYADGDSVGSRLATLTSLGAYQRFSRTIEAVMAAALGRALLAVYAPEGGGRRRDPRDYAVGGEPGHPFEVLAVGGDDVLLVCTADASLQVAVEYCNQFELGMRRSGPESVHEGGFSSSAGVVIAHDTMPVITLNERARELTSIAKSEGRQGLERQPDDGARAGQRADAEDAAAGTQVGAGMGEWSRGAIDFFAVSTSSLDELKTMRKREYTLPAEAGEEAMHVLMRPYPVSRWPELLAGARAVRKLVPSSKRHDLYSALFQTRLNATLDVLRVHAHLSPQARQHLLGIASSFGWHAHYPFGHDYRGEYVTGLADLLELAEIVGGPGDE